MIDELTIGPEPGFARRWKTPFESDSAFWRMSALVLGLVSFLKGLHAPNSWSATQAMVDYSQGWIKRGLFGATVARWFHLEHYARFSVFSYLLMAVFVALLCVMVSRSGALDRLGSGEPVALFFASFAVTYIADLVGYLDIPLGICTLGLLLIRNTWIRFAVAIPVCAMAILIHESFFLVFLPAILFSFVVDAHAEQDGRRRTRAWWMCGCLGLLGGALVGRLALLRPLDAAHVAAMQASIASRVDFPVRDDFFQVLYRTGAGNLQAMKNQFLHMRRWDVGVAEGVVIFAPTLLLLLVAIRHVLRVRSSRASESKALWWFAVVAACSPLSLYVFAWDSSRWDALACLEAFVVLLILSRNLPVGSVRLSSSYVRATILVIALSMATGETLLDPPPANPYPFAMRMLDVGKSLKHSGWVPPAR